MWSCGGFSSQSRFFYSYGDATITGEGIQILTYTRHSRPLSSESSLAYHTYCDTGHPFIMVISEDLQHLHLLPRFWNWNCRYLFLRFESVVAGFKHQTFSVQGLRSNLLLHRCGVHNFPLFKQI